MTHLFMLTYGEVDKLRKFITNCQAQSYPYIYPGQPAGRLHMQVREIKLLDLVFPGDHLNEVLDDLGGFNDPKKYSWLIKLLRNRMGAKTVKHEPNFTHKFNSKFVTKMLIGYKDDAFMDNGRELL